MDPFVALMRRYVVDYTNSHDLAVCDEIMEPDYVLRMGPHVVAGRDEAYKPATRKQLEQFPGLGLTVHEVVSNGERLALRFSEHGASVRHGGAVAVWGGIGLYAWNGRRLTANRVEQDYLARRRQLADGAADPVPPPAPAPWDTVAREPDPGTVRAARAWATSSEHERALVTRWCDPDASGTVIALPVVEPPADPRPVLPAAPVVGVFGFVYPGKGHRQVVRAASSLRRTGTEVAVRVVGAAAEGHADEVDDLRRLAAARDVPLEVTGHLPDDEVAAALRSVAVPVVAHRNVSASGSLNSWLAAGRRPLVRDGAYAREVAALREGTMTLFGDAGLADAIASALRRPRSTWVAAGADLRPHLDDTARAYRAWWSSVSPW